jgi:hypothetical protein
LKELKSYKGLQLLKMSYKQRVIIIESINAIFFFTRCKNFRQADSFFSWKNHLRHLTPLSIIPNY